MAQLVKNLPVMPGLGGSPGERKGYPVQYSGLENSMDCVVHGVAKSWTRLSGFHFTLCSRRNWTPGREVAGVKWGFKARLPFPSPWDIFHLRLNSSSYW